MESVVFLDVVVGEADPGVDDLLDEPVSFQIEGDFLAEFVEGEVLFRELFLKFEFGLPPLTEGALKPVGNFLFRNDNLLSIEFGQENFFVDQVLKRLLAPLRGVPRDFSR